MLRRQMRALRRDCIGREELDRRITEHFLRSEIYRNTPVLLIYASYDAETDTYAVIRQALADGKAVYLPRCEKESNVMHFYKISSLEDLKTDAFGIPAPIKNDEWRFTPGTEAVCVVPGLAFTPCGERLGYGRGYYDTFLERTDVCTVGLCYAFQVAKHIPVEAHDKRMRFLCTEHGMRPRRESQQDTERICGNERK